ncbi:hypothetical protein DW223_08320 [Butyricicoccus sp. AM18-35]|nr:hypothetical protein DW223_08320 [Butyricicoccus sp. AM18-35]
MLKLFWRIECLSEQKIHIARFSLWGCLTVTNKNRLLFSSLFSCYGKLCVFIIDFDITVLVSDQTAVFQKQFPFNYTKSSKVEQKYSISPLKCLQSVILKSEVSIMQCKGSTKSTVSGRFKIIVAEISGVICGVKIQVAAAANMK